MIHLWGASSCAYKHLYSYTPMYSYTYPHIHPIHATPPLLKSPTSTPPPTQHTNTHIFIQAPVPTHPHLPTPTTPTYQLLPPTQTQFQVVLLKGTCESMATPLTRMPSITWWAMWNKSMPWTHAPPFKKPSNMQPAPPCPGRSPCLWSTNMWNRSCG